MLAPSMFLTGFAAGFFFAAICHQNRSLIVDVNTAGLALVPIWMLGSLVLLRDMQLVLLSAAVVFLAAESSRYVTGQTLLVDGGISTGATRTLMQSAQADPKELPESS